MKSVSESMKEVETKKSHLQEQVDQLNEDCATLKAQGNNAIRCTAVHTMEVCLPPVVYKSTVLLLLIRLPTCHLKYHFPCDPVTGLMLVC